MYGRKKRNPPRSIDGDVITDQVAGDGNQEQQPDPADAVDLTKAGEEWHG